jgi:hypothetical protein
MFSMRSSSALASEGGPPQRLAAVLLRSPPVMAALVAARDVAAPDWLVSAGAVRDVVWDALNGRPTTAIPRAVDHRERQAAKGWHDRWPSLRHIDPG